MCVCVYVRDEQNASVHATYLLISKIKEPKLCALPGCHAPSVVEIKICATEIFMSIFIYKQYSERERKSEEEIEREVA